MSYTPSLTHELGNISVRLSNLNQHMELLGATQEAVTLYQSLVDNNPTSYTPDLACELSNLGIQLSNLNWHVESLGVTQESFSLHEALVIENHALYSSK